MCQDLQDAKLSHWLWYLILSYLSMQPGTAKTKQNGTVFQAYISGTCDAMAKTFCSFICSLLIVVEWHVQKNTVFHQRFRKGFPLRIWPHLLKKCLMENFFCAVWMWLKIINFIYFQARTFHFSISPDYTWSSWTRQKTLIFILMHFWLLMSNIH